MDPLSIVLASVPLVISALQCYEGTRKISDRLFNRQRHISRLKRDLQSYQHALGFLVDHLRKVIDEPSKRGSLPAVFDANERLKIIEYLGEPAYESFNNDLKEAHSTIEAIAKKLSIVLPNAHELENDFESISTNPSKSKVEFRKGVKLVLHAEKLDEEIAQLDRYIRNLDRFALLASQTRIMEATAPSKNSKKLGESLTKLQISATHLYRAIEMSWSSSCHPAHEARLMLEDRVDAIINNKSIGMSRPKPSIYFDMVFTSECQTTYESRFYEGRVELIEDEHESLGACDEDRRLSGSLSMPNKVARPTVTFTAPRARQQKAAIQEVENICNTLIHAEENNKRMQLYLLEHRRLHSSHPVNHTDHVPSRSAHSISLETLLQISKSTGDKAKKLQRTPCLILALSLASTFLQLITTPWFDSAWSKRTIHFNFPGDDASTGLEDISMAPQVVNPASVDLSRPFLVREFSSIHTTSVVTTSIDESKKMLLELGILLLEIYHGCTFEDYAVEIQESAPEKFYRRFALAREWIDATKNSFYPTYFRVTTKCFELCVRDINDTNWNEEIVREMVQGIIEPLKKICD